MHKVEVLYEDNHIIVVNKPSGALSQGDKTEDAPYSEYVKQYIKEKYKKPGDVYLGVPHRLDRPVSGVLLFARTSKALTRINEQFKNKEIQKTYWAVVKKLPPETEGTLIHYMKKNEANNTSKAHISSNKGGQYAELHYKIIGSLDNYHLLEITPKTGRHHQIRVQLASMGSPIKGDIKYGFQRPNDDKSIHLHARKLKFLHPVTKEWVEVKAPTPHKDVIWRSFAAVEAESK